MIWSGRGETRMIKTLKPSQYNFYVNDKNGNMIIYNFLEGHSGMVRISSGDVETFKRVFLDESICFENDDIRYQSASKQLLSLGVLVHDDIDEYARYEERHYCEAYNNRLHLTILPTGLCMFRCPYCYEAGQDFYRNRMTKEKQDALVKYVQRAIVNQTSLEIGWYGGEPLLELNTIKYLSELFIKICAARHIPYVAEMTTNAYLLRPEVFDQLYKLRVYTYMITLDGLKEQHDMIRHTSDGTGSFDTIIRNLLYIRDNPKYKFANIIVRINVSKEVYERLDKVVEFVANEFSGDRRFSITFAAVVQYTDKIDFQKYVDPMEMHRRLFDNTTYMEKVLDDRDKSLQLFPEKKCLAAKKNAYVIMPNLDVRKCYSFLEQENNKLGCINENGELMLDEIKHKRWYLANRYVQRVPEKCKKCFYLPCCRLISPGCPNRYTQKQSWQRCILDDDNAMTKLSDNIKNMLNDGICMVIGLRHIED